MTSADCSGNSHNRLSSLLSGIGGTRSCNLNSNFIDQSNTDLVQEFLSRHDQTLTVPEIMTGKLTGSKEFIKSLYETTLKQLEDPRFQYLAFKMLHACVEAGIIEAEYDIGHCFENGIGVQQDKKKAFQWYKKCAQKNNSASLHALGRCYFYGQCDQEINKKLAFDYFMKSAKLDNVNGEYAVGKCYYYGLGVKKDKCEALKWYNKSASRNDKRALLALGKHHYNNLDFWDALPYFYKGANLQCTEAQCYMGSSYYFAFENKKEKAFEWFQKSAKNGETYANVILAYLKYYGIGTTVDTHFDEKLIKEWLVDYDICNKDDILALFNDMKYADDVYVKALQNNHEYMHKLSSLYRNGIGFIKDDERADFWSNRSMEIVWQNSKL